MILKDILCTPFTISHTCISLFLCQRYLGAEWFHEATSFEAPGLYKANKWPMSHQENWVIRRKFSEFQERLFTSLVPPLLHHFALFLKGFFIFNKTCHQVKTVTFTLPTDDLPTWCCGNGCRYQNVNLTFKSDMFWVKEEYIYKSPIKRVSFSKLVSSCLFINRSITIIFGFHSIFLNELTLNKRD